VGSTATFHSIASSVDTANITNIKMSGGMEDSHRQDRDEFNGRNDDASVESAPKGQVQEVDIQAMANNMIPPPRHDPIDSSMFDGESESF
jgi:hypothetical protein